MAKLEIPVVIDGVKTIEELANRVLDEYEYKGRTIREWADRIAHPETNADRIRAMTDEELATWISSKTLCLDCPRYETDCSEIEADDCGNFAWLTWLKQEADE